MLMILGKHVQNKAYHGRKSGQSTTKGVIESERRENSTRKIDIEDFFFVWGGWGGKKNASLSTWWTNTPTIVSDINRLIENLLRAQKEF